MNDFERTIDFGVCKKQIGSSGGKLQVCKDQLCVVLNTGKFKIANPGTIECILQYETLRWLSKLRRHE